MSWEMPAHFVVKLGGNYFVNCGNLVTYDGEPLFALKRRDSDGRLGIDFDVYDERGDKVATIRNANVVTGDRDAYEVFHGADCHKVVEKATGRTIVQIEKHPNEPRVELAVTVRMYLPESGFLFEADPDKINIGTCRMIGCTMENCSVGIDIGESPGGAGFAFPKPEV